MTIQLWNTASAHLELPNGIAWRDIDRRMNVPWERLDGPGAVESGKSTMEPRRFELRGSIWYPDNALVETARDDILAFLRLAPIDIARYQGADRTIRAIPTGIPERWLNLRTELQLRIPFVAVDPYFYGALYDETEEITSTPHTWTIPAAGNENVEPVVTFIIEGGAAEDIELSNGDQSIELEGEWADGTEIVVDNARYLVTVDDLPAMEHATQDWLLDGFVVGPDDTELTFTADSLSSVHVTTRYRPRWI